MQKETENILSHSPGRCGCNLICVISKHITVIDMLRISYEIAVRLPQNLVDDKSVLVQDFM